MILAVAITFCSCKQSDINKKDTSEKSGVSSSSKSDVGEAETVPLDDSTTAKGGAKETSSAGKTKAPENTTTKKPNKAKPKAKTTTTKGSDKKNKGDTDKKDDVTLPTDAYELPPVPLR